MHAKPFKIKNPFTDLEKEITPNSLKHGFDLLKWRQSANESYKQTRYLTKPCLAHDRLNDIINNARSNWSFIVNTNNHYIMTIDKLFPIVVVKHSNLQI